MSRKRTNLIWIISKEEFEKIVKNNNSVSSILKKLNLSGSGASYRAFKKRVKIDNIDYDHIKLGRGSNKGKKFPGKGIPLEKVMIKNSTYGYGSLKRRLLREEILENKCSKCGLEPFWSGEELVMVMDHINGINNDHRRENLRLLCPNCNSQTDTFTGKNRDKGGIDRRERERKKKKIKKIYCKICKKEITKHSSTGYCQSCSQRKIKIRPSKDTLLNQVGKLGYCGTGRLYGVSDNAIRKWLKEMI